MMNDLPLIRAHHSLHCAAGRIQQYGKGIALVVGQNRRLLGVVTDGDIRRAVLANTDMGTEVRWLLASKAAAVTAPEGADPDELLSLMRAAGVRQIPVVDEKGRPVALATMDELAAAVPLEAAVMAGGLGTRLAPLTDATPKPMLPVGGRPILELTLERMRRAGIGRVHLVVGHLAEQIEAHFGEGDAGLEVRYVLEDEPLGTAGALGAIPSAGPLLVTNGDLVTGVDYRAMLEYHQARQADLTVAVRRLAWAVPYGVVDVDGAMVREVIEKPTAGLLVNAGIYLIEPYVQRHIPARSLAMTDVIAALLAMGRPVAAFPITDSEGWIDIGTPAEYARACEEVKST